LARLLKFCTQAGTPDFGSQVVEDEVVMSIGAPSEDTLMEGVYPVMLESLPFTNNLTSGFGVLVCSMDHRALSK